MGHLKKNSYCLRGQTGFSLVEMSIVLVIIGLILGAISIGVNLQRDAEYDKIKQTFIDQWVGAYNSYYQRTGVVLGDSQTAPRLMVNGENYNAPDGQPISGGDMSQVEAPAAVCEPALGSSQSLHALFDNLGIKMPPGRAEGYEDRYSYLDTNGNPQEIRVCFQWNRPGTPSGSGNVMVVSGLTPDLARKLDQMIDGKADAQEGQFRQDIVKDTAGGQAGVEWQGSNTQAIGQDVSAQGENKDEAQVIVVTAHYKMNQ